MGCNGYPSEDDLSNLKSGMSLIRCSYLIKDKNDIQIINNRGKVEINEEIKSKVKIFNDGKKEELILKKNLIKLELIPLIL